MPAVKVKLFQAAKLCLEESNLERKLEHSFASAKLIKQGSLDLTRTESGDLHIGRPEAPRLVEPGSLAKRGFATPSLRLALAHAIAHIEFNAINLAWDAIWHFQDMPEEYYRDWASVAEDETRHFLLLQNYMKDRACNYGDFDAHDGLWTMAENTAGDVLERMAIVPRVLEARGLDVTPPMIRKFRDSGDLEMTKILQTIYQEEIAHVQTGDRWFRFLCQSRGLQPDRTFIELLQKYNLASFKNELNVEARREAGFSQAELDSMVDM